MKKYLSKFKYTAWMLLTAMALVAGFAFTASADTTVNNWLKTDIANISTNTGNGLANANIHVAGCYIGTGFGTPCGGGGGGSPHLPFNSIQYNNAGSFFGDSLALRNPTTNQTIIGQITGTIESAFMLQNSKAILASVNSSNNENAGFNSGIDGGSMRAKIKYDNGANQVNELAMDNGKNQWLWDFNTADTITSKILQSENIFGAGIKGTQIIHADSSSNEKAMTIWGDISVGGISGFTIYNTASNASGQQNSSHIISSDDTFGIQTEYRNSSTNTDVKQIFNGSGSSLLWNPDTTSTKTTEIAQNQNVFGLGFQGTGIRAFNSNTNDFALSLTGYVPGGNEYRAILDANNGTAQSKVQLTSTDANLFHSPNGGTDAVGLTLNSKQFHFSRKEGLFTDIADLTIHINSGGGDPSSFYFGVGAGSTLENSTSGRNMGFGYLAGSSITTGSNDTGFGQASMVAVTTGDNNSFYGSSAGRFTSTGSSNTGIGEESLYLNSTGSDSTAVGYKSLYNNNASDNSAFGYNAGLNSTGATNVFFGSNAGLANTTGFDNMFIGYNAGSGSATGFSNIFIGKNSSVSVDGWNDSIGIGNGTQITANNQLLFGSFAHPIYEARIGDYTGAQNGTYLVVNDNVKKIGTISTAEFFVNGISSDTWLTVRPQDGVVELGDKSITNFNTVFKVDDPNKAILWQATNGMFGQKPGSTDHYIEANPTSGLYQFGNTLIGNGGILKYDDATQLYTLNKLGGSGNQVVTVDNAGVLGTASASTIDGSISLTAQNTDLGPSNVVTAPTGLYRVSYYLLNSTADLTAGAVTVTFGYNNGSGQTVASAPLVLTSAGGFIEGEFMAEIASGNLTYTVSHSGLFGTATYDIHITAEKLQ